MNTNSISKTATALITIAILCPLVANANQYEITWSTIDSGATSGTGGQYEITGAIGQPDTDISSSGQYTLSSGFWPGNFGCIVKLTDLIVLAEWWLDAQQGIPADIDGSGNVDFEDFARLAQSWYQTCPAEWPVK